MDSPALVTIELLRPQARPPSFGTEGAAGADLYACMDVPVCIAPGTQETIPTGIAMALPSADYVGLLYNRSGLGMRHGVALSNCVGVIDSDYRGEIHVSLRNHADVPYTVAPGDRVAQLIVTHIPRVVFETAAQLPPTARGDGGFGSTGR